MKNKVILSFIIVIMLFTPTTWANSNIDDNEKDLIINPMSIPMEAYIDTNKSVYEDTEIVELNVYCYGGIRDINDSIIYHCTLVDSEGNEWKFESEGETSITLGYYPVGKYTLTLSCKSSLGYRATASTVFEVK